MRSMDVYMKMTDPPRLQLLLAATSIPPCIRTALCKQAAGGTEWATSTVATAYKQQNVRYVYADEKQLRSHLCILHIRCILGHASPILAQARLPGCGKLVLAAFVGRERASRTAVSVCNSAQLR